MRGGSGLADDVGDGVVLDCAGVAGEFGMRRAVADDPGVGGGEAAGAWRGTARLAVDRLGGGVGVVGARAVVAVKADCFSWPHGRPVDLLGDPTEVLP